MPDEKLYTYPDSASPNEYRRVADLNEGTELSPLGKALFNFLITIPVVKDHGPCIRMMPKNKAEYRYTDRVELWIRERAFTFSNSINNVHQAAMDFRAGWQACHDSMMEKALNPPPKKTRSPHRKKN